RALPAHKAKPDDLATRLDLQFGMWLSIGAGTSGVGVGASHGIGHVLGAACHVPHGHTSCVMLPSVLRWNLPANGERQKRVSEAFGKPDAPAADLVAGLVASLGLPRRLADVGVGKERFREIAEKSMHDRAVLNNPRPINYLADLSVKPVTYNPPLGTGVPRREGNYQNFVVRLHNARPYAADLSLDHQAFILTKHDTRVRDFYDEQELKTGYYKEVEAL